jgi:hypothetical protein
MLTQREVPIVNYINDCQDAPVVLLELVVRLYSHWPITTQASSLGEIAYLEPFGFEDQGHGRLVLEVEQSDKWQKLSDDWRLVQPLGQLPEVSVAKLSRA